jgi:hypothetical protein
MKEFGSAESFAGWRRYVNVNLSAFRMSPRNPCSVSDSLSYSMPLAR